MSDTPAPFSPVARGRLPAISPGVRIVGLGSLAVAGFALGAWYLSRPSAAPPPQTGGTMWSAGPELKMPTPTPVAPADAPAPAAAPIPAPAAPKPPEAAAAPRRMMVWGDSKPVFATGARTDSANSTDGSTRRGSRAAGGDDDSRAGDQPTSEYGERMRPTRSSDYYARALPNIGWLLPKGQTISCITYSPISTQLVGGVSCLVDEPVWSADLTRILIDRGATISGEIQRGLGQGQDRAFILWTDVRSGGVGTELNSPGADRLGQIGVPGVVDEHLWDKIKATAVLTGIEGLSSAGTALASRGNGNNYLNLSPGRSLAEESLRHDINIPSTLWLGQATPLKVYVQHNVWFNRAYQDRVIR